MTPYTIHETLWATVLANQIPHDHHESDLYLPRTEATLQLVKHFNVYTTTFRSQTDGQLWIEIPFLYVPWWAKKCAAKG